MNDLVYKNYLFSSREFMVLSACAGMERLHLLREGRTEQISEQELNRIIFRLYQREILCWRDENSYELKPEISQLFHDMNEAEKELQVYAKRSASPLLCFWNDHTVVMELSGNDRDTVKLHSLPQNEFLAELQDRGVLPADNSGEIVDVAQEDNGELWKTFVKGCSRFMEQGHIRYEELKKYLSRKEELFSFITVCDRKTGRDQSVLLLLSYGMFDCIVCMKDGVTQMDYYTLDNLRRFLAA